MRMRNRRIQRANHAHGLTVLELLVVCAVIVVLMAFISPAIMQAREAARLIQCRNNLKQLGIAVHGYVEQFLVLPQTYAPVDSRKTIESDSWSILGHLLPNLDQTVIATALRLELDWAEPENQSTGISQQHFPWFSCPSDPNGSTLTFAGPREGYVYPTNYGFNYGLWLVFDPVTGAGGDGCFMRNGQIGMGQISDGLSNTLCAAEVKAYQPCILNTLDPGPSPPQSILIPGQYAISSHAMLGPQLADNEGHSEWCDGFVHQTGFTTTFAPNQFVPYKHVDGRTYDIDWSSRCEGTSAKRVTYAAITARSYHAGLVNILLMDGSVRGISQVIALTTWRSLGSRADNDLVGEY